MPILLLELLPQNWLDHRRSLANSDAVLCPHKFIPGIQPVTIMYLDEFAATRSDSAITTETGSLLGSYMAFPIN